MRVRAIKHRLHCTYHAISLYLLIVAEVLKTKLYYKLDLAGPIERYIS